MLAEHFHPGNNVSRRKRRRTQLYFENRAKLDDLQIQYKTLNDSEMKSDMEAMLENMDDQLSVIQSEVYQRVVFKPKSSKNQKSTRRSNRTYKTTNTKEESKSKTVESEEDSDEEFCIPAIQSFDDFEAPGFRQYSSTQFPNERKMRMTERI